MIPRYQRVVFWTLIVCILGMGILLFVTHQRARNRISDLADNTPIDAPYTNPAPITLALASDADGTITNTQRQLALPTETTARARGLLDHVIAEYAMPGSAHPLPAGSAVDEVFLLPLPIAGHAIDPSAPANVDDSAATTVVPNTDPNALQPQSPGGLLAVIDLRSSFVNSHPSGVETETLTLDSMLGTLHANLPQIEQVRFLVDGQPHETLAGHADLLRTYSTRDTSTSGK